jgi:hypothetical protein
VSVRDLFDYQDRGLIRIVIAPADHAKRSFA